MAVGQSGNFILLKAKLTRKLRLRSRHLLGRQFETLIQQSLIFPTYDIGALIFALFLKSLWGLTEQWLWITTARVQFYTRVILLKTAEGESTLQQKMLLFLFFCGDSKSNVYVSIAFYQEAVANLACVSHQGELHWYKPQFALAQLHQCISFSN